MAGFVVTERFVFRDSFLLAERTQVILPPLFLAAGRYQQLYEKSGEFKNLTLQMIKLSLWNYGKKI